MNTDGGDGTAIDIGTMAPLPSDETVESPISLVAVTLANMLIVSPRLKGAARRVAIGIKHCVFDLMVELVSASQFTRSF